MWDSVYTYQGMHVYYHLYQNKPVKHKTTFILTINFGLGLLLTLLSVLNVFTDTLPTPNF